MNEKIKPVNERLYRGIVKKNRTIVSEYEKRNGLWYMRCKSIPFAIHEAR